MSAPDLAAALANRKAEIRRAAHAARQRLPGKDELSRKIIDRLLASDVYQAAATVLFYVDVRDEVRTQAVLASAVNSGKQIAIPYCVDDQLRLFPLASMDELEPLTYGILEPREELRGLAEKRLDAEQLDLILVPGLAFDRDGGRIGYGKGYYDRLLATARRDAVLVALAYDCQIFDAIPMQPHDVYMDLVITESAVHSGRGRRS
ncbi:5-formyltetrahydrofolate cyclo-ligase [Candidatus Laterigemmans baculatus]|uniref:5-formyltetrahydrofolate cyclo-ligase n=1 Tax=Candidatus Laterigemmans baculatus TaxID=2770505 RepID=UPI0013DA471D|nr:5-formyltetrahydrofolate cyclo-ligase [Candidatus Laterigemmans baculatus]